VTTTIETITGVRAHFETFGKVPGSSFDKGLIELIHMTVKRLVAELEQDFAFQHNTGPQASKRKS
jgi:hypothetical protein